MRRLVLVLGVAAAAVGVWVMLATSGAEPTPAGIPSEVGPAGGGPDSSPIAGEVSAGEATDETVNDVDRSQIEAGAARTATALIPVLVTRKDDGEPIPGAEVKYYERYDSSELGPEEREEFLRLRGNFEKLTERFGTRTLADARGMVLIPMRENVSVMGWHGEMFGRLAIRPAAERGEGAVRRLELERDITLRVRVVDSRDVPVAGLGVFVLPRWDEDRGQRQGATVVHVSDAGGLVTVPHFQRVLSGWRRVEPQPIGHLLRARITGWTEGGVPFDGENPPQEPIVLRLPPTGQVVLHATDPAGARVPNDIVSRFSLVVAPEGERPFYERWVGAPGGDGFRTFDRVVAGQDYVVTARIGGETIQHLFHGPAVVDQRVDVTLSAGQNVYVLKGRLLDEQGRPLGKTRIRVRSVVYRGGSSNPSLTTAEDGTFRTFANVPGGAAEATMTEFLIEDLPLGADRNLPARTYLMTGERTLVPGENDLGEMVLSLGPLVASGQVLVNGEAPATRGYGLNVEVLDVSTVRNMTTERWLATRLRARFPELDRFEFRGATQPGRYRLAISGSGVLPADPLEFALGAEDVLIELDAGGSLVATVLVDEPMFLDYLWLRLEPSDGQAPEHDPNVLMTNPQFNNRLYARPGRQTGVDGHPFTWRSLRPGRYTLEVLPAGGTPLVEVRDIEIVGTERNEDPRLAEIDLRGKMRKITITAFDPDGKPLDIRDSPLVLLDDPRPDATLQGFSVTAGIVEIVTAEPFLNLLVAARGFVPSEISGVSTDIEVRLERFPEVLLRLVGTSVPEGYTLLARVQAEGGARDLRRFSSDRSAGGVDSWLTPSSALRAVGENGEVAVRVAGDGVHTVRLYLRNGETKISSGVRAFEPAEIEVRGGLGRQVFEITIPEEEMKKAREGTRRG